MQEKWFEECVDDNTINIYKEGDKEFVIYKGIKLERTNDGHRLLDVRYNDFYSRVSKPDKKILKRLGFIKGCDTLMYNRDIVRAKVYEQQLLDFYNEQKRLRKSLEKIVNKHSIKKRLGILERKVQEYIDLLFFYKTRKQQFEIKYKLN